MARHSNLPSDYWEARSRERGRDLERVALSEMEDEVTMHGHDAMDQMGKRMRFPSDEYYEQCESANGTLGSMQMVKFIAMLTKERDDLAGRDEHFTAQELQGKRIEELEKENQRLREALESVRDHAGCSSSTDEYKMYHCTLAKDFEPWEYHWERDHRAKCWGIAYRALKGEMQSF